MKFDGAVVISGGFDPIHIGHLRMIQDAAKLGEKLIGSSVLAFCFIFLPIFLYYRYSKRNLEDYIYKD